MDRQQNESFQSWATRIHNRATAILGKQFDYPRSRTSVEALLEKIKDMDLTGAPYENQDVIRRCQWLKVGSVSTCGRRCRNMYCHLHGPRLRKGMRLPVACQNCGRGTKSVSQLCCKCIAQHLGYPSKKRLMRRNTI